jgi:hypothetical protein
MYYFFSKNKRRRVPLADESKAGNGAAAHPPLPQV